jgi:hypothetical protein
MTDWSPAEDMRPGVQLTRKQPELTSRGRLWTQLTFLELNGFRLDGGVVYGLKAYTQLKIRDCDGDVLVGHGDIRPVVVPEDDGA